MHRADIVLIGPLDPLLPRTIRVRLSVVVAISVMMFSVGLLSVAFLTTQQSWSPSSTFPWLAGVLPVSESRQDPRADDVTVRIGSRPAGAAILRGNRELAHTPATITAAQQDLLVLRRDGFLDAFVRARGPSVEAPLWHVQPDVRVLRPPFPGAAIKSAAFLPDGRVSLAVEVPPNSERQAWAYDPTAARMDRLGRAGVPGTIPSTVAVAPDAIHTATIVRLDGLDGTAADQLTLAGPSGPRQPLTAPSTGERLLDASWSPRSDVVLLLSSSHVTGGTRFHLRLVGAEAQARDVADLPGEPIAGSWVWASDGSAVAFLVHTSTSTTALVALDLVSGELRYLDDLRADALPSGGLHRETCCTRRPRTAAHPLEARRRSCSGWHHGALTHIAWGMWSRFGARLYATTASCSRWRAARTMCWCFGREIKTGASWRSSVSEYRWPVPSLPAGTSAAASY